MNNNKLESGNFLCDFSTIKPDNIQTENTALLVLLGLDVKSANEYLALREAQTKQSERSAIGIFQKSFEEFWNQYVTFMFSYTRSDYTLESVLRKLRKLAKWNGDFEEYAQTLYTNGLIYKPAVSEGLKNIGITLEYSKDAPAYKFYNHALQKGIWSFTEAACLIKGQDPFPIYEDLPLDMSQDYMLLHMYEDGEVSATITHYTGEYLTDLNLSELIHKHIAAEIIQDVTYTPKNKNKLYPINEPYFFPKDIVKWFIENSLYTPRRVLLDILYGEESYSGLDAQRQLRIDEVNAVLKKNNETRGRKKGDGSYNDHHHFIAMRSLIEDEVANSVRHAARLVVENRCKKHAPVKGSGTEESKITRLAKGFSHFKSF